MQITLYTKTECGLCEDLKADLLALRQDRAFHTLHLTIHEVNIESAAELQTKFQYLAPVLELPTGELRYPPHDYSTLRAALLAASTAQIGGQSADQSPDP